MAATIPRYLGPAESLPLGMYTSGGHLIAGPVVAAVRCPDCGAIIELGADHEVDRAGRVMPAFGCQTATCSFSAFLVLEAWGEVT